MILDPENIKLTAEEKKQFKKEYKEYCKRARKIMKEKDRRLVALLSLICEKENIKPSDLCLCIQQPKVENDVLTVKMFFKKREVDNG